jgi:hypothetical protein
MTYSLVQRLFARRLRADVAGRPTDPGMVVLPDGTADDGSPAAPGPAAVPAPGAPAPGRPAEPVEVASLQLSQVRSFDRDLSTADLDGDAVIDATSRYSPVQLSGRFNPIPATSVDLRTSYDILFHKVRDVSLSGALRARLAALSVSMFHRRGLALGQQDSTQAQFGAGLNLLRGRLRVKLGGSWDADPSGGGSHFPNQKWQVSYDTQCCSFLVERITRDFALPEDRREVYFRIDLTGVGKLFDQSF